MFRAALWSALPDQPHSGFLHTNTAWLSRLTFATKYRRNAFAGAMLARAPQAQIAPALRASSHPRTASLRRYGSQDRPPISSLC